MKGNDSIFAGAGLDAALKILSLQIDFKRLVSCDAKAAVDHHENDAGGGVIPMAPEFVDFRLCERFSFLYIIFLIDIDILGIILFHDIVFYGVFIHLRIQFFNIGKAGVAEGAFVESFLHMGFSDGGEDQIVERGDILIGTGIINAAVSG